MYRIAVIEDHKPVNDGLKDLLEEIFPGCEVQQFFELKPAISAIGSTKFDLVVSDVDLGPGTDKYAGIKIAKALDTLRVPLLIVSGSPEYEIQHDIFRALDAWDYLQKPISPDDFKLQVKRALAYAGNSDAPQVDAAQKMQFPLVPDLSIQGRGRGPAKWKGNKVSLTMTELAIVEELALKAHHVVSQKDLFEHIPTGKNVENLRVKISSIRKSFEEVDKEFDWIKSVPLFGYMWRPN